MDRRKILENKNKAIPNIFLSSEVDYFEKNEMNYLTTKLIEEKMDKIKRKKEGEEDSDNDINGWCLDNKIHLNFC